MLHRINVYKAFMRMRGTFWWCLQPVVLNDTTRCVCDAACHTLSHTKIPK